MISHRYQSDMVSWPAAQQQYTLIARQGTEGFKPVGCADTGVMTCLLAQYEVLPPIDDADWAGASVDAHTDGMTYQGKLLTHIAPGRGLGVGDEPGLKLMGDVDPEDVTQGQVGDCWLLSAISALAEFDGAVKRLFAKTEGDITEMPRAAPNFYTVTLYDLPSWQQVDVVVDERLPASPDNKGQLLASRPSADGELWVPYLEKAIAVHCGGWDKICGGQCTHAWRMLTGCKEQYTIKQLDPVQQPNMYSCFGAHGPKPGSGAGAGAGEEVGHCNSPHDGFQGSWQMAWPEVGGGGAYSTSP
jgi:hypothetical protein